MDKKPEKKKKVKWTPPVINTINFKKSEGKFGTFDEATDENGNVIGS